MTKDILKNLYNGNFHEWDRNDKEFMHTVEHQRKVEIYEKLSATFTAEQEKLFDELFLADGDFESLRLERTYANGFQLGFWLAMELADFNPEL